MKPFEIVFLFAFVMLCIKGQESKEIPLQNNENVNKYLYKTKGHIFETKVDTLEIKKYKFPARLSWENGKTREIN